MAADRYPVLTQRFWLTLAVYLQCKFQVQKKTLSMENPQSKFQQQMFVQLFTDPQKCIEQIQVSNSAIA